MKKSKKDQEGTAIVAVMAFTLLSSILSAALLASGTSQAKVSRNQLNMEKALFVAEAGAERAAQYVEEQRAYLPAVYTDNGTVGDGTYSYQLDKIAWRTYSLRSVGTVNGVSREVTIDRLYIPTYATYALWMHTNGHIYFIPGEEFFGHVHSNDKLWFYSNPVDGGPLFWKELTSGWSTYGGTLDWATFTMGFEMDSAQGQMSDIDFNSPDSFSLKSLASNLGIVLEGNTTIEFADENMIISNARMGWSDHVVPITDDQIVYVADATSGDTSNDAGKIFLEGGTVDGRITLVSEDDTRISDHVDYKFDPLVFPSSENAVGMISMDDVWVEASAPTSLRIDGAIIAAGTKSATNRGSFGVINYSSGGPKGPLNVYGSIVQDKRGAVGTFNDAGMVSGFYKNYSFDDRFEGSAPPYYPVIDDSIQFKGWKEGPA